DEHEGLDAIRAHALFGFQALADDLPVARVGNRTGPFPQLALRRAHEIPAARLAQPLQVVFTRHAAVHHPDPLGQAVARFHGLDDLLHRRHVGAIAGDDLVTDRHPLARVDEGDTDLLAVGAVVAAVPTGGQRVGLGHALEVHTGDVVE